MDGVNSSPDGAGIPVSVIIPTRHRCNSLMRTIDSLLKQTVRAHEIVIVDASADTTTRQAISELYASGVEYTGIVWLAATQAGAAAQRNQGIAASSQSTVLFCDDDIVLEPNCVESLWVAMQSDPQLGGVSSMITNQQYHRPGMASRFMLTLIDGTRRNSLAGRVIGPAINLLPENNTQLPDVVTVEWLNLGCTMYRRPALPSPPFDSVFTGYSAFEDLTLSLRVAQRGWKLANVRTARVYHDSQPGEHKSDAAVVSEMDLTNRLYVMREILRKTTPADYGRLAVWELFQLVVKLSRPRSWKTVPPHVKGRIRALRRSRVRDVTQPSR